MRWEIRLAGQGGQGVILIAILLAAAAIEYEGLDAIQTQSYGPESRGGASLAEVIISDEKIDYPKVGVPDVVLAMSQLACDTYSGTVKPGGILLLNASLIHDVPPINARVYAVPVTEIAAKQARNIFSSNMVALGVLTAISGVVSLEGLTRVSEDRIPARYRDSDLRALNIGYDTGCGIALAGVAKMYESGKRLGHR